MEESKRQKMVAGLLNAELDDIFRRLGLNMVDGGMISISNVKVTPDLLEARIYLSFFQVAEPAAMLKKVVDKAWEVKKELAARVGKQLRRMPDLQYYHDDTLDYVFKMEQLLKEVNQADLDNPEKA
jgi:ribosome-binding factor A